MTPRLETRAARAKLKISPQPYYRALEGGLHLGYRKGKNGGVWVARQRLGKHYCVETIARADDYSEANGTGALDYRQAQVRVRALAEEHNNPAEKQGAGPLTIAEAVECYLLWLAAHRKSEKSSRNRAENDILPGLGSKQAGRLAAKELREWLTALAERPRRVRGAKGKPARLLDPPATSDDIRRRRSSANRSLTILKAALNHAFQDGHVASDEAWRRVKPFREADAARLRYLTRAECMRLVNACAGQDFRNLVNAALLSGARYGELIRLSVRDFNQATLHIAESKSGKPRHIILTNEGASFFAGLCAGRVGDALMLTKGGEPWGMSHQSRPMSEACKQADINPPMSFHGLRHTYASLAVMDGVPLMLIARNLGHADTRMAEKHYGHLADDFVARTIRERARPLGIAIQTDVAALGQAK